ncbi:UDP-3-O-acyl-N-acetylglucosamine deacetylase [Vannielia litorea]|uniref:UDP-3-O-acyl-N-acetylglucosamine deacetylase n=1 Tax=Vannielia litorea TaxID=1217970 RepID=UPI001C937379|nr:UDP-3-O-acyl-N-acetylglucosamine deacetylase [Vannielia litorea]MBY6046824.1 UDP-3-O-acyl-N-acetylglucosamine deacetylase [Vannielia litorea]MBY6074238.1 UDP-3-O-acyl-N-acetylglucosamine deacetylase [Vannielia litorea]
MQTTLNKSVTLSGVGLHSGRPARITLKPAMADQGIWFRRTDAVEGDAFLPARWDAVVESPLCTLLTNDDGVSLSTVEHVMAALAGCGVHNALVEVSGPEVPILDGSAAPFVSAILRAGLRELDAPVRAIRVLKPVEVKRGEAVARLEPSESLIIDFSIDFEDAAIGAQDKVMNMANGAFVRELCDSRTFCRAADVEAMRSEGKALGGTYLNAVVVEGDRVLSPGGLRHEDEPVRHKMLDALGDLALAGHPILGHYTGERAGHAMTNALLRALFADPEAYEVVTCDADMVRRLPGTGLKSRDLRLVA